LGSRFDREDWRKGIVQNRGNRAARSSEAGQSRETVLFSSLVLLAGLFVFTGVVSRAYHVRAASLPREWSGRGDAALQAGQVKQALEDFRSALVYAPYDRALQLRLAEALIASGENQAARGYLLTLLAQSPNDGKVNLELARVEVREGSIADAMRYYQAAIYGVWEDSPFEARRQARTELCKYLIEHKQTQQAEAEIMALVGDVSEEDTPHLIQVGDLFLRVGNAGRALHEFQLALRNALDNPEALAGAGKAEFELGAYQQAANYLARARKAGNNDPAVAQMLENSWLVLEVDPFLPGLTQAERARRAARAFEEALARIEECAGQHGVTLSNPSGGSPLADIYSRGEAMRKTWSGPNLRQHADQIEPAMNMAFQMESVAEKQCATPQGVNLALLLLGKRHPGLEN
jgi:tetratricopeptide (TPR) repeat protein